MKHVSHAVLGSLLALAFFSAQAGAAVVDPARSFFTPQAGLNYSAPLEGLDAVRYFRMCPNNDGGGSVPFNAGGASLPLNARLKIKLVDTDGAPMTVSASDIYILFNGGTSPQGFSGVGADSIIANFQYNQIANCPDVRRIFADHDTNPLTGETFVTLTGVDGIRASNRKWGNYEGDIPVFALGVLLSGRLLPSSTQGSYTLHIKNFDSEGGRTTIPNQGELVNIGDYNGLSSGIDMYRYSVDFDSDGAVCLTDMNMLLWHYFHKCNVPLAP